MNHAPVSARFTVGHVTLLVLMSLGVMQTTHAPAFAQDAPSGQLTIHIDTVRDVGGYSEVQEIFSVMPGGRDFRTKKYLRDANVQGLRNIINWLPFPDAIEWPTFVQDDPRAMRANKRFAELGFKYAPWAKGHKPQFETVEQANQWYDNFLAMDPYELWSDMLPVHEALVGYFDDSYGPVSVIMSPHPGLYDGRLERDMDAARRHIAAYIQVLKDLIGPDVQTRLRYFQLQNEPNQGRYWAAQFDNNQLKAAESYTRVFNGLYDHLKRVHPDVELIGNAVGHNGTYRITKYEHDHPFEVGFVEDSDTVDWNTWVKRFIDLVDNPEALKYFNAHAYSIPTRRNLANVSMTQNYTDMTRGVRPRYIITETSGTRGDHPERSQFLFHGYDMLMQANHPDKFAVRNAYVMVPSDDVHGFFEDEHNLSFMDTQKIDDGLTPRARYYPLLTFKNIRGDLLHYENTNPDVAAIVSSPRDQQVAIGLFNPTAQAQRLTLDLGQANDRIVRVVRRKAVFDDAIGNARYTEHVVELDWPHVLTMEPYSAYAFELDFPGKIEPTQVARVREFYGDAVKQALDEPVTSTIDIASMPEDIDKAMIRVGIDRHRSSGRFAIRFNDQVYPVQWSDVPGKALPSWNYTSGYVEIPIDTQQLRATNEITVQAMDDNMLLFTSVVTRSIP